MLWDFSLHNIFQMITFKNGDEKSSCQGLRMVVVARKRPFGDETVLYLDHGGGYMTHPGDKCHRAEHIHVDDEG